MSITPSDQVLLDPRLQLWSDRRGRSRQLKNEHEDDWLNYWAYYRNHVTPLTDDLDWWRSNEMIPTPFKIIETLVPKQILGLFGDPDWFNPQARNGRSEVYEQLAKQLLLQTYDQMDIITTIIDARRYREIMGHVWYKMTWEEDYEYQRTFTQRQLTLGEVLEQEGDDAGDLAYQFPPEALATPTPIPAVDETLERKLSYENPRLTYITLDKMFPDPTGRNKWFIEDIDTTWEELSETNEGVFERSGEYLYSPAMLNMLATDINRGETGKVDSDPITGNSGGMRGNDYPREPESTEGIPDYIVSPQREGVGVRLEQCWGWVPKNARVNDKVEWRLTVIANGKYILRDDPAPTPDLKPPYWGSKSIAIPGRLYGESILKYIGPLADQQSRIANMRLDEVFLSIWGQFYVEDNALASDANLLIQPGGGVTLRPPVGKSAKDVFGHIQKPPVLNEAYTEDAYRQTQAEHAAGAGGLQQGVGVDADSATEVERLVQQGGARQLMQLLYDNSQEKKELLNRTWAWLKYKLTNDRVVRMQGEEFAVINLHDLQEDLDFVLGGGIATLSKAQRLMMSQQLLQLVQLDPTRFHLSAVLEQAITDIGWLDTGRFVKSDEEYQQEQYMQGLDQAASQLASMQLTGGGMGSVPAQPGAGSPGTTSQGVMQALSRPGLERSLGGGTS